MLLAWVGAGEVPRTAALAGGALVLAALLANEGLAPALSGAARQTGLSIEGMKQLSGLDATFLFLETPEMPMHVGALHLFELPAGYRGRFVNALRKHMAERLPLAPVAAPARCGGCR